MTQLALNKLGVGFCFLVPFCSLTSRAHAQVDQTVNKYFQWREQNATDKPVSGVAGYERGGTKDKMQNKDLAKMTKMTKRYVRRLQRLWLDCNVK